MTSETVLLKAVTLGLLCDSRGMNRVVDYVWLCALLVSQQKMVGVAGYNNCLKDRVKWLINYRSLTVEIVQCDT